MAAQILGDMGADVIKVEGEKLDSGRVLGGSIDEDLSGVALNLHRNKRSIRLDLKQDSGRGVLLRLLDSADVFITNMRPAALARLRLDHDNLVEHLAAATKPGGETGYSRILSKHRGPHRTKDGYIAAMPYSDRDWTALYEAVGRGHELEEDWFTSHRQRLENPDRVYGSLATVMAQRTTKEWIDLCLEIGVPAGLTLAIELARRGVDFRLVEKLDEPFCGSRGKGTSHAARRCSRTWASLTVSSRSSGAPSRGCGCMAPTGASRTHRRRRNPRQPSPTVR